MFNLGLSLYFYLPNQQLGLSLYFYSPNRQLGLSLYFYSPNRQLGLSLYLYSCFYSLMFIIRRGLLYLGIFCCILFQQEGLEVWIDIERMGGSTLSAMAEAVASC
jgi:hypothetical protein